VARRTDDSQTGFLWVEEGQSNTAVVADVAIALPFRGVTSYFVPPELVASVEIGRRVRAPIGRRGNPAEGFVVAVDERPWDGTLPSIIEALDERSHLSPELVALGKEIAEHYFCAVGVALKAMTPECVRSQKGFREERFLSLAVPADELLNQKLGTRQRAIIAALAASDVAISARSLLEAAGASSATLKTLIDRGWMTVELRKVAKAEYALPPRTDEPDFELNDEQRQAIERIGGKVHDAAFSVTLLFGVSGSGKTEVYVHAIRRALAMGKQAILLVPEIALTTQLVERLAARFDDVAINHSGLTDVQRSLMWDRVADGRSAVVIGTRSAVFAPCPNLGLIIIDEEQESSFKNLQTPRFHVRDVAIARARALNIPIVLGSATPSVEVWFRSETRADYDRIVLGHRVKGLPMPAVTVVDMRDEETRHAVSPVLSNAMRRMLDKTLDNNEQAILLINRRGFAQRLYCPSCRTRVECPNCHTGFVDHAAGGFALCHYCLARIPIPTHCANLTCGRPLIRLGAGTQRVEDVIKSRFPHARVARADSDTMKRPSDYQQLVGRFSRREVDVLVGTQMIAKGLDFPYVSFVGVINADPTALAADFRAQERAFQLVTQVAGRAGRSESQGRVVLQTTMPELPAIQCALDHDYERFVAGELESRQRVGWPPFSRLARVVLAHAQESVAKEEADDMVKRIEDLAECHESFKADCLGPTPCAVTRIRGRYRFEFLVRTPDTMALRRFMALLQESGTLRTRAQSMMVDVDPVSMT
jgi:primosomal protein N' (replication factor Y)